MVNRQNSVRWLPLAEYKAAKAAAISGKGTVAAPAQAATVPEAKPTAAPAEPKHARDMTPKEYETARRSIDVRRTSAMPFSK